MSSLYKNMINFTSRNGNAEENPGTNPIIFFHKFTCTRRYLKVNLSASAAKSYKKLRALVMWD